MAAIGDLFDLAQLLLDIVAEALDTIPAFDTTLEGAPERQFVSPGQPVNDFVSADCCSAIAVWAVPTVEADTTPGGLNAGRRAARQAWINHVGLNAVVWRCIPVGESSAVGVYTPPTAAQLTESARQHLADGWALWNHLHNAQSFGEILDLCDEVFFDGITPTIPAGGCAGWIIAFRAALGGYTEALGS